MRRWLATVIDKQNWSIYISILCLSVIFPIDHTTICNVRDYWRILWNLQVSNFVFFFLCFLFVAIIFAIAICILDKLWLVATLFQQFSVFLKYLASSIVYLNLFSKIYLSCILGTIITLNCITNWNRVHP